MDVEEHRNVQAIAKNVLKHLGDFITPASTEATIAAKAKELLETCGVHETWYHDVPAFVLLGSRSRLSISGRDYEPAGETVGDDGLVTVDLSPSRDGVWGDCARSFVVENGICTSEPKTAQFVDGLRTEMLLHQRMMEFVTPETKFSELYDFGNALIRECGYECLDFLGNLGHSIERTLAERRFIDRRCHETLGSVKLFTFEPHIGRPGGRWGFKHENIYYFDENNEVIEL